MLYSMVTHTPVWVWLLLIYLLRIGYKGLFAQPISAKKTLLLPALFFLMSLYSIPLSWSYFGSWLFCLLIGAAAGYPCFYSQIKQAYQDDNACCYLPGSPNMLLVLLTIFALHYLLSVLTAIDSKTWWRAAEHSITWLGNGIFTCRSLLIFLQLRQRNRPVAVESSNK